MPAACDLSRIYGDLAQRVPDGPPQQDCIIFHGGNLPEPPASLVTDAIVIRKATHDYGGWYRADSLWMYLAPSTSRKLGLFLLAAGFHGPKTDTVLELEHPESDIR